jgi:hypothetical protein
VQVWSVMSFCDLRRRFGCDAPYCPIVKFDKDANLAQFLAYAPSRHREAERWLT